jgi:Zn-dependent peptidase ImmA (M78 family)
VGVFDAGGNRLQTRIAFVKLKKTATSFSFPLIHTYMPDLLNIAPVVLRWARENTNFTKAIVLDHFDQPSKREFGLSAALLDQIESRPTGIKVRLLKELAAFYKQPLAVFFLEEPPQREKKLRDLRTRHNRNSIISPATMLVVRSARRAQMIGRELLEEFGESFGFTFASYSTTSSPTNLGAMFREQIGLSPDKQAAFRKPDDLFVWLRSKIEDTGVLVLKEPFPIEDALAFSLTDDQPFTVVVNSKWGGRNYAPKLFSLLHEYAHLLLRHGGICDDFTSSARGVEAFCNRFAASVLIPADLFAKELSKLTSAFDPDQVEFYLTKLTEVFKASRPALLVRFLERGLITQEMFDAKIAEWNSAYEPDIKAEIPFRVYPHTKAINGKGRRLSELIVRGVAEQKISRDAAADFLDIQPTYLLKVANKLGKKL